MTDLRRMPPSDASGMNEVHTEAVRRICTAHVTPAVVEAWLAGRTPEGYARAAQEGESFWVAVDKGNQIFGFGSWRGDELAALYVDPQIHGRGIGRGLFTACETDARENGLSFTRLNATLNATSYYEALGFRKVRDGYNEKRGQRIPHMEMIREIPR